LLHLVLSGVTGGKVTPFADVDFRQGTTVPRGTSGDGTSGHGHLWTRSLWIQRSGGDP
jgi:hypothetical protein